MNYAKEMRVNRRNARNVRATSLAVYGLAALILALGTTILAAGGVIQGAVIILCAVFMVGNGFWFERAARDYDRAADTYERLEDEWRASWH